MIQMKLNEKLNKMGLSQREFSKIVGIRQPTISAYCNNTYVMIPKEHIEILCKFFSCKVDDLIEYIPDPK